MIDPLADIVNALQPGPLHAKVATGAGAWRVRRQPDEQQFFCILLDGCAHLVVNGRTPVDLATGDYVLLPAGAGFEMRGRRQPEPGGSDPDSWAWIGDGIHHGDPDLPPDARLLVGHFAFRSPDSVLLSALLPDMLVARSDARLAAIVQLIGDEAAARRPAREAVIAKLLEVMLLEALRLTIGPDSGPGLVRGLADERLAATIRMIHERPDSPWTMTKMAKEAAISRSAFFDRFKRSVGMPPMQYLLSWRMALAKNLLERRDIALSDIAEQVGYGSASAFSVAFTRTFGVPPAQFRTNKIATAATR